MRRQEEICGFDSSCLAYLLNAGSPRPRHLKHDEANAKMDMHAVCCAVYRPAGPESDR